MVVGGAGKQLALTANALSNKGHLVEIYSYFGGPLEHKLSANVHYIPQNPIPQNKLTEYILSPINIRRQIKKSRPNIVISWRCNAGCFTRLASIGLNVKIVFSERTDPYTETSLALKISSWICGFSSGGVFQLEKVRQYYKRLYNKSIVIHNPIDENIKTLNAIPYNDRSKKIVHVGRMMLPHKRQDVMLEAFRIFLEHNSDYELHFYGDGRDFDDVKKMAVEKSVSNNVVFHGAINGIPENIKDAKILVLTSDYEGIPNVILEAFASDVPVVSTDCSPGGARLLLGNDENGLLAPIGDAKKIAMQMQHIVDDEKLAQIFISKGRAKLNDFRPETIFTKWEEYLKSVVQ
jgi:glycosyltransferase involved in cell wall biosynthesis